MDVYLVRVSGCSATELHCIRLVGSDDMVMRLRRDVSDEDVRWQHGRLANKQAEEW